MMFPCGGEKRVLPPKLGHDSLHLSNRSRSWPRPVPTVGAERAEGSQAGETKDKDSTKVGGDGRIKRIPRAIPRRSDFGKLPAIYREEREVSGVRETASKVDGVDRKGK